jgi:hypothetical protein
MSESDDSNDLFSPPTPPVFNSIKTCAATSIGNDDDELFGSVAKKKVEEDAWPTNEQDIVRYLINKQKFDGCWDFDSKIIEQLTGKALNDFKQTTNNEILVTAIVVTVLEKRFASLSSMWHGIVQKARKRLIDLLGKDMNKLHSLFENINKQL